MLSRPEVYPGGVKWVVIGTRPETADKTVHECVDVGIDRAWIHRAFGSGNVSQEGVEIRTRARGDGH